MGVQRPQLAAGKEALAGGVVLMKNKPTSSRSQAVFLKFSLGLLASQRAGARREEGGGYLKPHFLSGASMRDPVSGMLSWVHRCHSGCCGVHAGAFCGGKR